MSNQDVVQSLRREIIQPGVDQLMSGRFVDELSGALSRRRRATWCGSSQPNSTASTTHTLESVSASLEWIFSTL
jgi:hypothetical protein